MLKETIEGVAVVVPEGGESQYQMGFESEEPQGDVEEPIKKEPQPEAPPIPDVIPDVIPDAAPGKQTREERVDEKRPSDPVALENWNRWKTSTGLLERERTRAATLEAELAKERAVRTQPVQSEKQPDDELDSMEEKYMDALVENDRDTAKRVRKEIDAFKLKQFQDVVGEQTTRALTEDRAKQSIQAVAAETYAKYPTLDIEAEDANHDAILYVQAKAGSYMNEGVGKTEALRKAVKDAAQIFYPEKAAPGIETEALEAKAPIDEGKLKAMAPVSAKSAPVRVNQKAKGSGTYEDGFNSA